MLQCDIERTGRYRLGLVTFFCVILLKCEQETFAVSCVPVVV